MPESARRRPAAVAEIDAIDEIGDQPLEKRSRTQTKGSSASSSTAEIAAKPPDAHDNERYFCEYAHLYHQMDMLEDSQRTDAYRDAIVSNPGCFEGKVVLDVGAGTCILSIFAAQAGARQVFAVEATDVAKRARKIVEANGLAETITVIQGTVETAEIPCKVDVIISEWMGYFLLRESMLDSVLFARDKFLKPGGAMFPSHAALLLAPVAKVPELQKKKELWNDELQHWSNFSTEMDSRYGVDFSCVREDFCREQRKYYLQTSAFVNLAPKQLVGLAKVLQEFDLSNLSKQELENPSSASSVTLRLTRDGPIEGLCGYFDAFFKGSPDNPTEQEVTLSTAPTSGTSTHWGQQVFLLDPPLAAKRGDILDCSIRLRRQAQNHRLLQFEAHLKLTSQGVGGKMVVKDERVEQFYID